MTMLVIAAGARLVQRWRAAGGRSLVLDSPASATAADGAAGIEKLALAFVVEMRGSLSNERLHDVIVEKLPPLLGVDGMWFELNVGHRRRVMASPRLHEAPPVDPLSDGAGEWATFPLRAGETEVGVMGVPILHRPLAPSARRAAATLAPLIADSLLTAHTISNLRELSTVDAVTGCATRHDGLDRLRAELKRAQRSSQQVAILMLDLDFFKSINDQYGHPCGDSVLASIGQTIMQTLRASDLRCRWGGEEFLIALPESGLEQARHVAGALARRIAATVTEFDSAKIQLTASIGVTIAMPGEEDPEPVLARADAALYRAKAEGRNCIRIMMRETPAAAPTPVLAFRDRRDPARNDRRQHPGPGRRATDLMQASRARRGGEPDAAGARAHASPV
jgi:diguanylate cyclase (GGDEF)-like protein